MYVRQKFIIVKKLFYEGYTVFVTKVLVLFFHGQTYLKFLNFFEFLMFSYVETTPSILSEGWVAKSGEGWVAKSL
jgi:hypothetical protein